MKKQASRNDFLGRTKKEMLDHYKTSQSYRAALRKSSRKIYLDSGKPLKCAVCGYADNSTIEVCHIISIEDFSDNCKISEINSLDNLIALCCNHHKKLDKLKKTHDAKAVLDILYKEHRQEVDSKCDQYTGEDILSEDDLLAIQNIGKKYNAKRIILFGSGCDPLTENNDIDLAVEGVSDSLFFKFYSELIFSLSKPVYIFDLKMKSKFSALAASEGLVLYG